MSDDQNTFKLTEPLKKASSDTLIKNRYQIERELGHGGVGVVYLARDLQLHNRPVVIKVLLDSLSGEWITKKFRQEIEALARLEHPGIVGVLDTGTMPNGQLFVVMQFVEGKTLRKVLDEQTQPMDLEQVARIMEQVGRALEAAHDKGILHCDLKPENIMVQQLRAGDDFIKLIDFGIAKIRDSQITSAAPTQIAGTLEYMAPEQMNGEPCPASDVFAMGVISYEMVTGKKPFPSRNILQLIEMHRSGIKESPASLRTDLPPAADRAILKAVSPDPNNRHQRPAEFTDELVRGLRSKSGEVQPTIVSQPELQKSSSWSALAIIVGALVVVAGLSWWILQTPKSQPSIVVSKTLPTPPKAVAPTPSLPERTFEYGIVVQRFRNNKPYKEPFRLAREAYFEPGDHIQLRIQFPQPGFFYVVNDGPLGKDGVPQYNLLFPSPLSNISAQIADNQEISIPSKGWFVFDKEEGPEKLWFIFSTEAIPELEDVKSFVNPTDKGSIKDPEKAKHVMRFLEANSGSKLETEKDDGNIETVVHGKGPVLVHLVTLELH